MTEATARQTPADTNGNGDDGNPPLTLMQRVGDFFLRTPSLWTYAVLIVLVIVFSIASHGTFGSVYNLRNIALDASLLMVVSVGMTMVILSGGIDLSVGAVTIFGGVIAGLIMEKLGGNGLGTILIGLVAAVAVGIGWGAVNGIFVTWLRVAPLIATLGTLGMATGLALVITSGNDIRSVPQPLVNGLGNGSILGIPWLVVVAVVVTALGILYLNYTQPGLYLFAIGSNRDAVVRTGVKLRRNVLSVYIIIGALAGLAGYLSLARFQTTNLVGHTTDNLQAIAAVVLGGTSLFGGRGGIGGTVAGVLIPAVLSNGLVILGVAPFWQQFAIGLVLVIAVYSDQLRRSRIERE
jgi:ribose transport system permease protein